MLYASAPARILLAAVAGLKVFVHGGRMGGDERRALLGIMVYDGLGGAALGAWLGYVYSYIVRRNDLRVDLLNYAKALLGSWDFSKCVLT